MVDTGKKAFIIGHPVAHSRSPMIHGYWLKQLGILGSYERIDVAPENVEAFLSALPGSGFGGGNVTIPHKEAAFGAADEIDEAAELIGAANTLWLEDGKLHASNSDAFGFMSDLDQRAEGWRDADTALVLGAGGASRAILFALEQAGISKIHVVNRTVARAQELADRFGARVSAHSFDAVDELAADAKLVVNTTALGMGGKGDLPMDVSRLPSSAIAVDIVYTPLETPFLAAANQRGIRTIDGLGMLLHQAIPGFERWFGTRPEVTKELRDLIVADLEQHR